MEEAESEDSGQAMSISLAEVVKKLLGGRAPEIDEIHPVMLKALNIVGLSWLTHLFIVMDSI